MQIDNTHSVLPKNFDGNFWFTNFTDEEFKAKWNSKEYTFPANATSKLIILDATPQETQSIRKKFAKELAEKEFFKSKKLSDLSAQNTQALNSFRTAVTYTPNDLEGYVQRCLEPLPVAEISVTEVPKIDDELIGKRDNKGKRVTRIVDQDESLIGDGQIVA